MINVNVKKLVADAIIPTYGSEDAACFDLYAIEDMFIFPQQTVAVGTGLSFEVSKGYEMQIRPRSGISLKTPLRMANSPGTVDADYRGEVKVLLWNSSQMFGLGETYAFGLDGKTKRHTSTPERQKLGFKHGLPMNTVFVGKGERIAQAIIKKIEKTEFVVVEDVSETIRGEGGFGHTGIK